MHLAYLFALGSIVGIWVSNAIPASSPTWAFATLVIAAVLRKRRRLCVFLAALALAALRQMSAEVSFEKIHDRAEAVMAQPVDDVLIEGEVVSVSPGRGVTVEANLGRVYLALREPGPFPEIGERLRCRARLERWLRFPAMGTRGPPAWAQPQIPIFSAQAMTLCLPLGGASTWSSHVEGARGRIRDALATRLPADDGRALMLALSTGDRGELRTTLVDAFTAAGIVHLIAISGLHLGALSLVLFALVRFAWLRTPWAVSISAYRIAAVASAVGVTAFCLLSGARPSTLRALFMCLYVLLGLVCDRKANAKTALPYAVVILLALWPELLWNVGAQLSVAAVTALIWTPPIGPPVESSSLRWMVSLAQASLISFAATVPLLIYHFGEVSRVAIAANLVFVPLATGVILPLLALSLSALCFWPWLGTELLVLVHRVCNGFCELSLAIDDAYPLARVAPISSLMALLLLVLVGSLLFASHRASSRGRWALSACLALASTLVFVFGAPRKFCGVRVSFLSVGHGDAAVIELPDGQVWLVDGGGLPFLSAGERDKDSTRQERPGRKRVLPFLRARGLERIDLAIISHPHPDHYIGLKAVARELPIAEVWSAHDFRRSPPVYRQWLDELRRGGTKVVAPPLGEAKSAGEAKLEVLWPRYRETDKESVARADPVLSVNDNSLVVRLSYANRHLLFTGDLEAEGERWLLRETREQLRSDLVKVPHHGSRTSSTPEFARAVSPTIAVVSVGRGGRFGLPNREAISAWLGLGSHVLRTDTVGRITVEIEPSSRLSVHVQGRFHTTEGKFD